MRIRDQLILRQSDIDAWGDGSPLFVARNVVLDTDLRFYSARERATLTIIADVLDGRGHHIDASGKKPTAAGSDGTAGASRPYWQMPTDDIEKVVGNDGEPGTGGANGDNGRAVEVWAGTVRNLAYIDLSGAPGGRGGKGGDGGGGSVLTVNPGWGGNGGRGGPGSTGGTGGNLTWVSGEGDTEIRPAGGAAGEPGPGGRPGYPWMQLFYNDTSKPGVPKVPATMRARAGQQAPPLAGEFGGPGTAGQMGSHRLDGLESVGAPGEYTRSLHRRLRAERKDIAYAWGNFRARRADWLFRTASEQPSRYADALVEAEAAMDLLPEPFIPMPPRLPPVFEGLSSSREDHAGVDSYPSIGVTLPTLDLRDTSRRLAETVAGLIRQGGTPFGIPWDFDPEFGFDRYAAALRDMLLLFNQGIERVESRIETALTIAAITDSMNLVDESAKGALLVIAEDLKVIQSKQTGVENEIAVLQERWKENQESIRERRQELLEAKALGELTSFVSTAFAIASALTTGFGAVSALLAVHDVVVKATSLIGTGKTGILDDLVDFGKSTPELKPEAKAVITKGTAFWDAQAKAFSAAKTVHQAAKATGDEKIDKLLAEQAKLVVEASRLKGALGQISLERQVVESRKTASETLSRRASEAVARARDSDSALAGLSMLLIGQIRLYADTLHRYHFQAARSLQRWLFDESRPAVMSAYGWVNPELEESLTELPGPALSPDQLNDNRRHALVAYLTAVQESSSRFDFAGLLPVFDESLNGLAYSTVTVDLTGADLANINEDRTVEFVLHESQLPADVRWFAHVEGVQVLAPGIEGLDFVISQGADWTARGPDGASLSGRERSRTVLARAVSTAALLEQSITAKLSELREHGPSPMNQLWGTSPCRTWSMRFAAPNHPPVSGCRLTIVVSGKKSS